MPDGATAVWAELVIDAPEALAEAVAAYVAVTVTGGGVEVRDAETLLRPGRAGRVELVAYVPPDRADACAADLHGRFADLGIAIRLRNEDEWRDIWKQYFKPRRVGRRFLVRPSWETAPSAPGDLVLEIDPGRAFGTGGHESTRLVLCLLEDLPAPERFLDVGTGSGILAIAAAALWPGARGLAIDVDPEALACARENLGRNGALGRVETAAELAQASGHFGLVMANITAEALFDLGDALRQRLAPGGHLLLSGMLRESADAVAERQRAHGLVLDRVLDEGEWRAVRLARRS